MLEDISSRALFQMPILQIRTLYGVYCTVRRTVQISGSLSNVSNALD